MRNILKGVIERFDRSHIIVKNLTQEFAQFLLENH